MCYRTAGLRGMLRSRSLRRRVVGVDGPTVTVARQALTAAAVEVAGRQVARLTVVAEGVVVADASYARNCIAREL